MMDILKITRGSVKVFLYRNVIHSPAFLTKYANDVLHNVYFLYVFIGLFLQLF